MKALVYIELKSGEVRTSSLEAISAAKVVAESVSAYVFGEITSNAPVAGTEKVIVSEASQAFSPEEHAQGLFEAAKKGGYEAIFISATPKGKEIAPRLAVLMDAAFLGDVLEVKLENNAVCAKRSLFGGKVLGWFKADSSAVVVTTRPKLFDVAEGESGSVENMTVNDIPSRKAQVIEASAAASGNVDLTEADIIISGGRGMKGPENFSLLKDLAETLNGVVGASRAAVDSGWIEHSSQVGQTGKVVAPEVYFAVGISGAIQHLAGMTSSKVIIAINKDPDAPIFKIADFGIVGDAMSVVPALTEEIKKSRNG